MLRDPAELLPIMPPRVARLAVATSGPNARPNRASSALRWSSTTPGWTRTGPAAHVDVADAVEVLRAVDDEAGADRLAGQARAAAAGGDRHAHLGGDLHRDGQVVGRLGIATPSGRIW